MKEQKEADENYKLQQRLYDIQAENERLRHELEVSRESIEISEKDHAIDDPLQQSILLKEEVSVPLKYR